MPYVLSCEIVTILLLDLIASSRVIPFANFQSTVQPHADYRDFNDGGGGGGDGRDYYTAAKANNREDDARRKYSDSDMIAHPATGKGYYRDPLEVFGPGFPAKDVLNSCEMTLLLQADSVAAVQFTGVGKKTCVSMCGQYRENMIVDGPADVILIQGYCDYVGSTADAKDETSLAARCTCAFKVRCNRRTTVVMYTFETNGEGYVKVSFSEANRSHHVT